MDRDSRGGLVVMTRPDASVPGRVEQAWPIPAVATAAAVPRNSRRVAWSRTRSG